MLKIIKLNLNGFFTPKLTIESAKIPNPQRAAYDIDDNHGKILNMRLAVVSQRQPLFCEKNPLENAQRRFGFIFPEPPLVNHASESKSIPWWFYLGHSQCQLSNPIETQVRETLWLLHNSRNEELTSLLDIFSQGDNVILLNNIAIKH